jgi:peptidoglycan/LPS O-acetylase OafA/YrhL
MVPSCKYTLLRSQLNSIQSLRAIAAILVAYAHSVDLQRNYMHAHSFQQHFFYLPGFGSFGVDLFFVISGFIISYSAGRYTGGPDGYAFLGHRFKRINPFYYLATLLFIIIKCLHAFLKNRHYPFTWTAVLKSIFLLPILDGTSFTGKILPVAWTLSFEWLFYLLFLVTILSRTRHKQRWLVAMIAALVITGSFLHGGDYRLHFISNPILLEFMLGVVIYDCYSRIMVPKKISWILLLAGTGLCIGEIIAGFGEIGDSVHILDGSLSLQRFFYWGIPAALIVASCLFLEKSGSRNLIWNNRLVNLLGNSSYSLYLSHLIVYYLFVSLYVRLGLFLNPDLAILVQLALAIFAGVLFYKWVEAPLLRRLRKKNSSYSISTTLPR